MVEDVGDIVGASVVAVVGASVVTAVGPADGAAVGDPDGARDTVGAADGAFVGDAVGRLQLPFIGKRAWKLSENSQPLGSLVVVMRYLFGVSVRPLFQTKN